MVNHNKKNIAGQQYERLTAVKCLRKDEKRQRMVWLCKCLCGNEIELLIVCWGRKKSCGCLRRETCSSTGKTNKKHGESFNPTFRVWRAMLNRCYSTKNKSYERYGGRGITVCDEWLPENDGLNNFLKWAEENGYRKGLELNRIDNDGPYSPKNCNVLSKSKNLVNTHKTITVTYNGMTDTLNNLCNVFDKDYLVVRSRLCYQGWTIEEAMEIPIRASKNQKKFVFDGEEHTYKTAAKKYGLTVGAIRTRISSGMTLEEAIRKPLS